MISASIIFQIQNALQTYIINRLHTGNQFIDALLVTFIVSFVSYFVSKHVYVIAQLRRYFSCKDDSLVLPRYKTVQRPYYDLNITNEDYESFIWYISEVEPMKKGHGCLCTTVDNNDKIKKQNTTLVPAKNTSAKILLGQHLVSYALLENEPTKENSNKNERIVINGNKKCSINDLSIHLGDVRKRYNMYKEQLQKVPKMFRLHRNRDKPNDRIFVWKGVPTHSTKSFDTVVLNAELKTMLQTDVERFLQSGKWYSDMAISYKRGFMLYGPAGTGKTSLVLAISNLAEYDIYCMDLSKINSDSELDEAFEQLPDKCTVLCEDIDCMTDIVKKREYQKVQIETKESNSNGNSNNNDVDRSKKSTLSLSSLLNHLDGVCNNHGRIYVMTTNHIEHLDSALIRPGRIDVSVPMNNCSIEQICGLFKMYYTSDDNESYKSYMHTLKSAMISCHYKDELSPASVSSILQQHISAPHSAISELRKRVEKAKNEENTFVKTI